MGIKVGLLGPIELLTEETSYSIEGPYVRALLATLAFEPKRTVGHDALIQSLWDTPPSSADAILRKLAFRLRRQLGGVQEDLSGLVETRRGTCAYALAIDREHTDLENFRTAWSAGRRALGAADLSTAGTYLRQATALWRGVAGDDVPPVGQTFHRLNSLNDQRLAVVEDLAATTIACGDAASVVDQLQTLVHARPLRERAAALLLIGQYRLGDLSSALETYRRVRTGLAEELGMTPGYRLEALHLALLNRDDDQLFSNERCLRWDDR